jgi:hypothetical protein
MVRTSIEFQGLLCENFLDFSHKTGYTPLAMKVFTTIEK